MNQAKVHWCVKDAEQYFFNANDVRVPYDTDEVIDARAPRHHNSDMSSSKGGMSIRHPKGKIPSDVLQVNRAGQVPTLRGEAKHTAPYPMELVRELLKGVVDDDFLVIDPFCGSGQTGIAAAERNCRFIKIKYGSTESMNESLALIPSTTFGKAKAALDRRSKKKVR